MSDNTYFKKHVCNDCIKSGDNMHDGIECAMSDSDIDNCVCAMSPGGD